MATREFFAKVRGWAFSNLGSRQAAIKAALVGRWLELTGSLNSTLLDYQAAMDVREEDGGSTLVFALAAKPSMAQNVEFGMVPYNLQDTLLRMTTRNIRVSKKGHLYLFVPFGHTTREIRERGGSVGERMARALTPYPSGKTGSLPAGVAEKDPYHATDILAGLVRHAPRPGQYGSRYMTWRTISQNGRPWFHRGIQSRNFMRQVLQYEADSIIARVSEGGAG